VSLGTSICTGPISVSAVLPRTRYGNSRHPGQRIRVCRNPGNRISPFQSGPNTRLGSVQQRPRGRPDRCRPRERVATAVGTRPLSGCNRGNSRRCPGSCALRLSGTVHPTVNNTSSNTCDTTASRAVLHGPGCRRRCSSRRYRPSSGHPASCNCHCPCFRRTTCFGTWSTNASRFVLGNRVRSWGCSYRCRTSCARRLSRTSRLCSCPHRTGIDSGCTTAIRTASSRLARYQRWLGQTRWRHLELVGLRLPLPP